jgi:RNA polymerase sigma factor (TIGR02999 family)
VKVDQITGLLNQWATGDDAALNLLLPAMYAELRRVANAYLHGERNVNTLQPTALVNEAIVRLLGGKRPDQWESRTQLIGVMARIMREVLVDATRKRKAAKRPQNAERVDIDFIDIAIDSDIVLSIHDALIDLEAIHPRQARVVELKYFGGLSLDEIAKLTDASESTVTRDWRLARAWLQRHMGSDAI